MIRVIATVTLKEGKRKKYLQELYKIMPMVHIESGCIEYGPHIDADSGFPMQTKLGSDVVTIIERWQNLEALKKHSIARHMNTFRQATKEFIREMKLIVLTPAQL
jgi:quinol monooxygenase YgiN